MVNDNTFPKQQLKKEKYKISLNKRNSLCVEMTVCMIMCYK